MGAARRRTDRNPVVTSRVGTARQRGRDGRIPAEGPSGHRGGSLIDEQPRTVVRLPADPYGDPKPRRPWLSRGTRALLFLVVVAIALGVIAIVNRSHHSSANSGQHPSTGTTGSSQNAGSSSSASPTTPFSAVPGAGGTSEGVPIGYPHNQAGAVSAAANYVAAYGSAAMLKPSTRHPIVQAIADPTALTNIDQQLDTAFKTVDQVLGLNENGDPPKGLGVVYRTIPAGAHAVTYNDNKAQVAVWICELGGLAGSGSTLPVTETWSTVTLTLNWTSGDWKWASFTSADGPVPVGGSQTASSATALKAQSDLFGELRYGG